jgi:hypothetical protein
MILIAASVLLVVGATPVLAAPGGVPGPPADHGNHGKQDTEVVAPDGDGTTSNVPDWAKAYGRRIQDEYGMTYGHLQQCAKTTDSSDDTQPVDLSTATDDGSVTTLTACPEDLQFPEDGQGAKAFWVFTEQGMLILGL